jgi:hypothetical protein
MLENIFLKILFNYLIFNKLIQQIKNKIIEIDNYKMMMMNKDMKIHKPMILRFRLFNQLFSCLEKILDEKSACGIEKCLTL